MSKSIEIIRRVVSTDHVDLPAASVDAVAARVASYMNVADDVEPPEFEVRSALRIIHLSQNSLFKAPPTSSYVFDLLKAERESNGLRITGERRIELHRMVEVMSVAEREATVARMSQDVITKVRRDAAERELSRSNEPAPTARATKSDKEWLAHYDAMTGEDHRRLLPSKQREIVAHLRSQDAARNQDRERAELARLQRTPEAERSTRDRMTIHRLESLLKETGASA